VAIGSVEAEGKESRGPDFASRSAGKSTGRANILGDETGMAIRAAFKR
jgi:hypothetical protein